MLKYIDEIPVMKKGKKAEIYAGIIREFASSGKPYAMIDNDLMPKSGGRHVFDSKDVHFNAESTAYGLQLAAKAMELNVRVTRRGNEIYLINKDLAGE